MDEAVARAREFAVAAHVEQRYGDQPYSVHLDAVAKLLAPFGEVAQVVGYLHDVVEDTAVPLDSVRREFGDQVSKYEVFRSFDSITNFSCALNAFKR